jgi:transcriptional regulator with XRE-family HTH domain
VPKKLSPKESLAINLTVVRAQAKKGGMSQEELAISSRVQLNNIRRAESGLGGLTGDELLQIAAVLKVSAETLTKPIVSDTRSAEEKLIAMKREGGSVEARALIGASNEAHFFRPLFRRDTNPFQRLCRRIQRLFRGR